jgi:hypothetical protein
MLGDGSRASRMLYKYCTTEPHTQTPKVLFHIYFSRALLYTANPSPSWSVATTALFSDSQKHYPLLLANTADRF